jgi:hypothetical protein
MAISSIHLKNLPYTGMDDSSALRNLLRINFFIGPNNNGKSRLIRALAGTKNLEFLPDGFPLEEINQAISKFKEAASSHASQPIRSSSNIDAPINQIATIEYLEEGKNAQFPFDQFYSSADRLRIHGNLSWINYTQKQYGTELLQIFNRDLMVKDREIRGWLPINQEFNKVYIPILRGLRPLQIEGAEDLFEDRIKTEYFKNGNAPEIFTGQSVARSVRRFLLGESNERRLIAEFQKFLSEIFFESKEVLLLPEETGSELRVKIGGEEKPIYNLGDGVQALIMLSLPLFLHSGKSTLFFIEEPESMLHPGMQRQLLKLFSENRVGFENFQFFLTTHSNHFLDISLDFKDVSVYVLSKELTKTDDPDKESATFKFETASSGSENALDVLGVRNTSVYLSNCTIWVEGITDRLYLREFLRLYQEKNGGRKFIEDLHYSFVEYEGGNIEHWNFDTPSSKNSLNQPIAARLCGKLLLIADQDAGKETRHERLKAILGERFLLLPRREIENLLSVDTILHVLEHYEKKEIEPARINYEDYAMVGMGIYLESLFNTEFQKERKASYAEASGTVNEKTRFCELVCEKMQNAEYKWENLSLEAKVLATRLYKFIEAENK